MGAAEAGPLVITPSGGSPGRELGELWAHRSLLYFVVWRDVKLRYRQTVLGAAWAVLQPLATMGLFTVVFSRFARVPSDGFPYPLWTYSGLVAWVYFVSVLGRASTSVVGNAALVTKVYFPRLILPLAAALSSLLDFAISSVLLLGFLAWYGIVPGPAVLAWPLFAALTVAVALGFALWAAALNVRYRDIEHLVPMVTQFWLFATPIAYPSSLVPEPWHTLLGLNPMAGVVEGFRWAWLSATPSVPLVALSTAVALAVLAGGLAYFQRVQADFADFV